MSRAGVDAGGRPRSRSLLNGDSRARVLARRAIVAGVVVLQLAFVVRAYHADHKEFGFQMFPEASEWQAEIVRVTTDERRIPIEEPWAGYTWPELAGGRGLRYPAVKHHADGGLDNQLAFLQSALDWAAAHTPNDTETLYYEAVVTYWYNADDPEIVVMRSHERDV